MTSRANASRALVFTDLDGSLLDHHSYSYAAAMPQMRVLERMAIPLIPATSKTRAEIEQLRGELRNRHPFIVENGAAVFIPEGYFDQQPAGTVSRDGYWLREMAPPRAQWLECLTQMRGEFDSEFDSFFSAGTRGIMSMTGLSELRARQANQREYSEPVHWLGRQSRKQQFVAALQQRGATVLQGGRFLAVAGDCDKGRALQWLRGLYQAQWHLESLHDLAIGDSSNDCAMLEVAATALLIRSPAHEFPTLQRSQGILRSRAQGPSGWAEGVARWLAELPDSAATVTTDRNQTHG